MRVLLAIALVGLAAAPAAAQKKVYRSHTPSKHATYAPKQGVSPVKYAGTSRVPSVVHGGGCTSCDSGCDSCNSCRSGCCSPLPNLIDNIADVFVSLKPCPGPCSPCVRPVHTCPYPRTCPPSNCCQPRRASLKDTILGSCIFGKTCRSCCDSGCAANCTTGCASCTAGESHELLTPPSPPMPMKEDPFKDDPPGTEREARRTIKTTSSRQWYKKSNNAPIVNAEFDEPGTIYIGSAEPIGRR